MADETTTSLVDQCNLIARMSRALADALGRGEQTSKTTAPEPVAEKYAVFPGWGPFYNTPDEALAAASDKVVENHQHNKIALIGSMPRSTRMLVARVERVVEKQPPAPPETVVRAPVVGDYHKRGGDYPRSRKADPWSA